MSYLTSRHSEFEVRRWYLSNCHKPEVLTLLSFELDGDRSDIMNRNRNSYICMYCGETKYDNRTKEHIVPKCLGGKLTLNAKGNTAVCKNCNNEGLSSLDQELCTHSPLSAVASNVLGKSMWRTWDKDHSCNDLLTEAKPIWENNLLLNYHNYPQIIFDNDNTYYLGDEKEFREYGMYDSKELLFKSAKNWLVNFKSGKNKSRITDHIKEHPPGRFPPRLFSRRDLNSIKNNFSKTTFYLRYQSNEDLDFAIHKIEQLAYPEKNNEWQRVRGSHEPSLVINYDLVKVNRCLIKIALNLLANSCVNTIVNIHNFESSFKKVLGEEPFRRGDLKSVGFVYNRCIQQIAKPDHAHSFRIVHDLDQWHIFLCFFGGEIGAYVKFDGPSSESWTTLDILAPLESSLWKYEPYNFILPMMNVTIYNPEESINRLFREKILLSETGSQEYY